MIMVPTWVLALAALLAAAAVFAPRLLRLIGEWQNKGASDQRTLLVAALSEMRKANEISLAFARGHEILQQEIQAQAVGIQQALAQSRTQSAPLGPEVTEPLMHQLQAIEQLLRENLGAHRQFLRDMMGTGGDEEDVILDKAKRLRAEYPDLSVEDALRRVRANSAYATR